MADAAGLNPAGGNTMWVRPPPPAPREIARWDNMNSSKIRSDEILKVAGIAATSHAASDTYALAAPNSIVRGARFSSASVGGNDEFGVDFSGERGRGLAKQYKETLTRIGLTLRSPGRTDIVAYRWIFPPLSDGAIDADFVQSARRVLTALIE